MSGPPSEADLVRFVYHEARLVDAQRYEEWLALFAEDGRYWVPLSPTQTDPLHEQSLASEDKMMLAIRIERLKSGKAYSMQRPVASQHVLQAPEVERCDAAANTYRTRTPFIYVEMRGDDQIVLAGSVAHHLRVVDGALRIVQKRADLLNAAAALPAIFLFP